MTASIQPRQTFRNFIQNLEKYLQFRAKRKLEHKLDLQKGTENATSNKIENRSNIEVKILNKQGIRTVALSSIEKC